MRLYRVDNEWLWTVLKEWDRYLPGKTRLIACGGTALTLQGIKESTKDIDFTVPDEKEHRTLIKTLERLGYRNVSGYGWARDDGFIFDLFQGNRVFDTELLNSPLEKGMHIPLKAFSKLSIGILNDYDLIISKLFRGDSIDIEDCLALIRARGKDFNLGDLKQRYVETAKYANNEKRVLKNFDVLLVRFDRESNREKNK